MTPSPSFFALLNPLRPLAELWSHRALLAQFTQRNVEMRHRGSFLGIVWAVLTPLFSLAIYTFVFNFVFNGRYGYSPTETRIDYALTLFLSLTLFQFVGEVMAVSPGVIIANPNFVKKVVFPLEVLPVAGVGGAFFNFLISASLVLVGCVLLGHHLTWSVLWLPVITAPLALFAIGLAWLLAAIGVFVRDIANGMGAITQIFLYASAVFYPIEFVRNGPLPAAWTVLKFNPILHATELARSTVLWQHEIVSRELTYLIAASLVTFVFGYACFTKAKPAFADVL